MRRPPILTLLSIPVLMIVLGGLVVWFAPAEQTLGDSIKSVYVHASLTITGRLGMTLAGILGFITLIRGYQGIANWAYRIAWAAWGFFLAGTIASMISATLTWGGVFWGEPRLRTAIQLLILALVVQIFNLGLESPRWRGFLHLLFLLVMIWAIGATDLVLHPQNPIGTSTATGIRLTFAMLTLFWLVGAGWVVWQLRPNTHHNFLKPQDNLA